jgi:hypothetical protein
MTELQRVERMVNMTLGKALAFGIYLPLLVIRRVIDAVRQWRGRCQTTKGS